MLHLILLVSMLTARPHPQTSAATLPIAAENSKHSITLQWNASVSKIDGYHIYRADCGGANFIYLKAVGTQKKFVDNIVIGGAIYTYKVRATYKNVESVDSNLFTVSVPLD